MSVENLLLLDHFLFSFNTPAFNRLKALSDVFKNCEYSEIKRPDASYEGVYLFARDGSYLEMYQNPTHTPNVFALALTTLSPSQEAITELPERFPTLQWATQQIQDAQNKPWYTYYGQFPVESSLQQGVVLWAMLYHNLRRHRPYQYRKKSPSKKKFTIQEFTATRFKIPPRYLEVIRTQSQWVPGNHSISDSKAVIRVLNPSLNIFEIVMEVDEEKAESKPVSATMQLVEGTPIESQQIKGTRLTRQHDTLIINF